MPSAHRQPTARVVTTSSGSGDTAARTPTFTKVQLRVHEVTCVKTTKEIDRDEIVLAAIQAEGEVVEKAQKKELRAKARKGDVLDVGKFKKGESQKYSKPKVVAEFELGAKELDFPRNFFGMLLMIEKDEGDIGAVVNAAVKAVEKDVTAAITKAATTTVTGLAGGLAAGGAAGSVVPIVGTAIGAAAGAAATAAMNAIKKSRKDDVFPPEVVDLALRSYPKEAGEVAGSKGVANFKAFNGHYKVVYSWSVR